MWELDHKKGWVLSNWCFQIVVLESLLDGKIKPVNPKGSNPWIFMRKTYAEAPILWPTWCEEPTPWKRPWYWERLRQEEKGATKDEMVGWHHWLNGHEFEQSLGDSEGQGNLACCSPWGHRVGHDLATEQQAHSYTHIRPTIKDKLTPMQHTIFWHMVFGAPNTIIMESHYILL